MKRFLVLIVVVLVGCGDAEIVKRVKSTGIIITDEQAEILSKVGMLELNGLTSITDEQAESLRFAAGRRHYLGKASGGCRRCRWKKSLPV